MNYLKLLTESNNEKFCVTAGILTKINGRFH